MIQGWLLSFAINFALRQVGRFHDQIDWTKVKRDLDVRVRATCPGGWFDDEAVAVIDWAVDTMAKTMVDDVLSQVVSSVLSGNWAGAIMTTKRLLLDSADKENLINAVLAA